MIKCHISSWSKINLKTNKTNLSYILPAMFPQKNVCRVFRNKFRHPRARSLFLVIIIVSTFIILISQNKLPSDLDRFQQSDHFATTKDGLILPSLPLSKLSDKIIPTATQLGDELEDCFIRFEKRIMRPHITDLEFHNKLWQVSVAYIFDLIFKYD